MRSAVSTLSGRSCSQRALAEELDKMVSNETPDPYSAWLDDGWLTEPSQLRDSDESITLIREEDLGEIRRELGTFGEGKWTSRKLVPWTIPMRYRKEFRFDRRIGGYPVAALGTLLYSEVEGAAWPKK